MKAPILLGILGAISEGSLQHLNNHHGHPFRPSATYKRHEMPSPQPPFQIVENQSISKRRLDVWKPISSDPTSAPVKAENIPPPVESTTASYWSPQYSTAANSLGEAPQRAYVQLTAGPTATANFAPKQTLNVQPAPAIKKPTPNLQLSSHVPELKRTRYPPTPKRPPPRPPVQPQKIFSQARVPVQKLRKPPILPGYPPRRGIFKQAQDRKDTGFLERRPVLIAPSKKVKKKFLKPLSAPFTFSKPPLPLKEVLVIRDNEKEPRRAVDRVDTAGFEDLLSHLDKYKEDDDYLPNNPTTKAPNPTKAPSPIKTAKLIRPTPPKPPKPPKPGKINEPPKPPKPTVQSDESEGSDIKPPSPPSTTTANIPSRPLFPTIQLQRQDVLKALDAVDQSVAPLVHAATVISNSLQGVGSQSVEEVLNNERQDAEEPLDGMVETLEFTVKEILAKPEPLIILSAVLLSVITGSAIGNTITTMRSNRNEETRFGGECPVGYEVVFIDEDGVMLRTGSVVNVRMKRESLEGISESVVDPARRGYPFRKVTKQVALDGDEEKEERHGGYYCKKIGDSVDTTGSKGVGIRVNSEEHPDGGQGQVSIQVGGVSVTVGEANKLAREDLHLDLEEYEDKEESEEERDLGQAEEVEIGGVVDVFIDSLRQIRSLLVG